MKLLLLALSVSGCQTTKIISVEAHGCTLVEFAEDVGTFACKTVTLKVAHPLTSLED